MLMYQLIIKLNAHVEQQYMKKAYSKKCRDNPPKSLRHGTPRLEFFVIIMFTGSRLQQNSVTSTDCPLQTELSDSCVLQLEQFLLG
ncbi:hypothetical protein PF010_g7646 [Phytophthora fragariae]|uniref:Uncharacterized protein n=1 Tax=Phytophthora fragariae TaxID=53985 RepID=A0A6G0LHU6_9STRA|nr:hypothetical protein PF010_g7646 [Phytophthora fragariae]